MFLFLLVSEFSVGGGVFGWCLYLGVLLSLVFLMGFVLSTSVDGGFC